MELTTALPVGEWYTDAPGNEAGYWPLDYPPLSGYQSWLHGTFLVGPAEPAALEFHASRGYESPSSKLLMRWSVVLSDLVGALGVWLLRVAACWCACARVWVCTQAGSGAPSR